MSRNASTVAMMIVAISLISSLRDGVDIQSLIPLLLVLAVTGFQDALN